MNKIYHIYARNQCILPCIKEEEFELTWRTLNQLIGIMRSDYQANDLSFEELEIHPEIIHSSSY
jgi:hypothetical protein